MFLVFESSSSSSSGINRKDMAALLRASVAFALWSSAFAHRSLPPGVTCGNQFNNSADALLIPNAKISWASYRIITCDAPVFWLKADTDANQNLSFTITVPKIDRFASLRVSVLIIGPDLPMLNSDDKAKVPASVIAEIPVGEGAVLHESPANQNNCSHLFSDMMGAASTVVDGRCHFHEPYGDTHSWVVMDLMMPTKAAGMHHFAVFTADGTPAKLSFACCDWPEDFTTAFAMPEADCPYCGTKQSFAHYSALFYESKNMADYGGFPEVQVCSTNTSASDVPTDDQCPNETSSDGGTGTQSESCALGCSGQECHSHNIFGQCSYTMQWITPLPQMHGANITSLILFKGDKIKFTSKGHQWPHNLAELPSAMHLDTCNWEGFTQVLSVSEVAAGTEVSFDKEGTFYYSCQMTGHCQLGQKLVVEVKDSSDGMRCHDHVDNATATQECEDGTIKAHVIGSAQYGAADDQCSEICSSERGLAWIAGSVEGFCSDSGYGEFLETKTVKPAGSPTDVKVRLMGKGAGSSQQHSCANGEVKAYFIGSADYGAVGDECSELCTTAQALAWMAGSVKGNCSDAGYTEFAEAKSVKPSGSPMEVSVRMMRKRVSATCHCHSFEQINCDATGDALYDEHIEEITEHCASMVDGSAQVCPYKCFQPFEVLHLHYLECSLRPKHKLFLQIAALGKCHKAAQAPFGTTCDELSASTTASASNSSSTAGSGTGPSTNTARSGTNATDSDNEEGTSYASRALVPFAALPLALAALIA
jgi:predicted nucleic-acid-binding Zn-ribbon protein